MLFQSFDTRKSLFTFLLLIFFFLTTFSTSVFAQTKEVDPINLKATSENFELVINMSNPSTKQVDSILTLFSQYLNVNVDTSLLIAKKAVEITAPQNNFSHQANAFIILGTAYNLKGQIEEGEKYLLQGLDLAQKSKNENAIASASNSLGYIKINQGNYKDALQYLLTAIKFFEKKNNNLEVFYPYMNICWAYVNLLDLEKASEYLLLASQIAEDLDDDGKRGFVYSNRASIYSAKAELFFHSADTSLINEKLFRDSAYFFNDKSFLEYEKALSISKKINDQYGIVNSINCMVNLKNQINDFDGALKLTKEAIQLSEETQIIPELVQSKISAANTYYGLEQYEKALFYGKESLQLAQEKNLATKENLSNQILYKTYKELKQYSNALTSLEAHEQYLQEVVGVNRDKTLAEMEAKFQNVKKQKQILEQENSIFELETNNRKMAIQRNSVFGGALLLGLLGFVSFYFNKIRRERNDKIAFAEALIFAQEEERKRIARDLHDGVGQSLLLIKKQLSSTHEVTTENQQLISDTLDEVRSISQDLHPFQLEKFGLTAAVNEVIHKVEKSTDLFVSKEMDNIDKLLDDKSEINLFRTIQESLNNIVKHSEATAAKISIQKQEKNLLIIIQDNGKGFDHELKIVTSKSLGLRTMFERIAAIGGQLKIERGQPKGTKINIQVPLGN